MSAPTSPRLRVGGLAKLSTCDWPGQLAATVFLRGCPWRCPYCHNPGLRNAAGDEIAWPEVMSFLEARRGLLDGVVFSGGEPTQQAALPAAVAQVRRLGFRVGLHTGGPSPARFSRLLPMLDWVGFDVKAPFGDYEQVTGVRGSGAKAEESLRLLVASGVDYEVRTTVHPALFGAEDLSRLGEQLVSLRVRRYVLQAFREVGCEDPSLRNAPGFGPTIPPSLREQFQELEVR